MSLTGKAAELSLDQQPWTAARCHRLLRPLLSRIASLRKDIATINSSSASILEPSASSSAVPQTASTNSSSTSTTITDHEWLAQPCRKRPRLTYAQRGARGRESSKDESEDAQVNSGGVTSRKKQTMRCFRQGGPSNDATTTSNYPLHGEIVAPTPLLRRARGDVVSSPLSASKVSSLVLTGTKGPSKIHPSTSDSRASQPQVRGRKMVASADAHRAFEGRLARLRAQKRMDRKYDYEEIYNSLEAVLKATSHSTSVPHPMRGHHHRKQGGGQGRGPRSFLDMCLRKVPQYIAELDAQKRRDAQQRGTISTLDDIGTDTQVYQHLESMGGADKGWKHLRTIVRANALVAMRHCISEELVNDASAIVLTFRCASVGEADELMAAFVAGRQYPQPRSPNSEFAEAASSLPLTILHTYATQWDKKMFALRLYSLLLSNENLPTDWLATPAFEKIWVMAIQAILSSDLVATDAIGFVITSVSLLCSRKKTLKGSAESIQLEKDMQTASDRTLTSALAMIASLSFLSEHETSPTTPTVANTADSSRKGSLVGDRLRYVLKTCITDLESRMVQGRKATCKIDLLYLALFLASAGVSENRDTHVANHLRRILGKLWDLQQAASGAVSRRSTSRATNAHQFDAMVHLIARTARNCGRGTSVAPHQCLDTIFEEMATLEIGHEPLRHLKGVVAFQVAQDTSDVRDLLYAEKLERQQAARPGLRDDRDSEQDKSDRGQRSTLFTGYRWEETIGEWVMVSPVREEKGRQARSKRQFQRSPLWLPTDSSSATTTTTTDDASPTRSRQAVTNGVAHHETDERLDDKDDEDSSSNADRQFEQMKQPAIIGRKRRWSRYDGDDETPSAMRKRLTPPSSIDRGVSTPSSSSTTTAAIAVGTTTTSGNGNSNSSTRSARPRIDLPPVHNHFIADVDQDQENRYRRMKKPSTDENDDYQWSRCSNSQKILAPTATIASSSTATRTHTVAGRRGASKKKNILGKRRRSTLMSSITNYRTNNLGDLGNSDDELGM